MRDNHRIDWDRDPRLENFAAELTSAVYPLMLRRGLREAWLEAELGLWRALAETVEEWAHRRPPAASADAVEAWREGLLADLTGSAFAIAQTTGLPGARPEVESCLSQAFRQVMRRFNHVS